MRAVTMRVQRSTIWLGLLSVMLAVALAAAGAHAQQQPPDQTNQDQQQNQDQSQGQTQGQDQSQSQAEQPIPAYHSPLASMANNSQPDTGAQQYAPDTTPLAGAENLSVGVPLERHSYWAPLLSVLATGDSNPLAGTNTGWVTYETIAGGVDLDKASRNSDLLLTYLGGGTFSNDSGLGNTVFQELGVTETLRWRRNTLSFIDEVAYLPESGFGYGGSVGLPGLSVGTLQPGFVPGETVLTTQGQRISNSFVTQFDRALSGRSSITLVGGYSLLHFFDNNLLNDADITFQGGYNYLLTRRDTVALLYHFDQLRFAAVSPRIDNHTVQASYGRRVTGRLAFQVAAGPEISVYPDSLLTLGTIATNSSAHLYWSMNSALTYQEELTSLGLSYFHGVTGGSGVFVGALSDQVSGSISRRLSRVATLGLNAGYSRNKELDTGVIASSNQYYGYWFAGASFLKPLTRTVSLSLAYQFQYQQSNDGFCIGVQCGTSFTRNVISLGVNWNARPIPLD
jgi:hypothetical protein